MRLAMRVGSALALAGAFALLASAPLTPPTNLIGDPGWLVLGTVAVLWASLGAAMRSRQTATDRELVLIFGVGQASLALVGVLSGPEAAALELVIGLGLMAAIVLPPRLAAYPIGLGIVAAVAPLALDASSGTIALSTGRVALLFGLSAAAMAWTSRVVELRTELADQREHAVRLARVDVLTGLGNRRALDEAVQIEREVVRRTNRPLCALVFDLDDFKLINDTAGHQEGDRILQEVASVLRAQLRRPDACFRWGGDEFVALMPDTGIVSAGRAADRVVVALRETCRRPDGQPMTITVGCAELLEAETAEDLLARADAALFAAKGLRNRVSRANPETT